ncbi:MAG: pyridoxal phosphate-dependent aminotransferase [Anaerovoracaceae bacterium]
MKIVTREKNKIESGIKLVHGGDVYSAREQLAQQNNPLDIHDFSANVNPLGLPEGVKKAIVESINGYSDYPDPLNRELTKAISQYEKIPAPFILCGNGAADLIFRLVIANKPKKAMVMAPTFAEYEEALACVDCQVMHYYLQEENDFQLDEGLIHALDEDLDMLFLCNPNNPTGQLISKDLLYKILCRCRELGILLVVDECFNSFLDKPEVYSVKEYLEEFDNLLILKAFTKIYAMAGLRLGYCLSGNESLLQSMTKAGQPWSVSAVAQVAGIQAVKEEKYVEETKRLITEERAYLVESLRELGVLVISSGANYIFLKWPLSTKHPLHQLLLEKGFLIRNCDNYVGLSRGYYRICVKTHEDNVLFVDAISEIINDIENLKEM